MPTSDDKGETKLSEENKKKICQKIFDGDFNDNECVVVGGNAPTNSHHASSYDPEPDIVDKDGNKTTLSQIQKDGIYRKAKDMEEKIKEILCTEEELANPTEANVQKCRNENKNVHLMETYRKSMKAIKADPTDYSTESMRKRGSINVKYFGGIDFDEKGNVING